jgi:hypothetical protein
MKIEHGKALSNLFTKFDPIKYEVKNSVDLNYLVKDYLLRLNQWNSIGKSKNKTREKQIKNDCDVLTNSLLTLIHFKSSTSQVNSISETNRNAKTPNKNHNKREKEKDYNTPNTSINNAYIGHKLPDSTPITISSIKTFVELDFLGSINNNNNHIQNSSDHTTAIISNEITSSILSKTPKNASIKPKNTSLTLFPLIASQNTIININPTTLPSNHLTLSTTSHFGKLRVLLTLLCTTELRNSQALNINALYYTLAKLNISALLKTSLPDFDMVANILKRNTAFLQAENKRKQTDQYQLGCVKFNAKTEVAGMLLHNSDPNEYLAFDFFSEFFPLGEMNTFLEVAGLFCLGKDAEVFSGLSSMNHVGFVGKWMCLLRMGFWESLFEDVRSYVIRHRESGKNRKKEKEKGNYHCEMTVFRMGKTGKPCFNANKGKAKLDNVVVNSKNERKENGDSNENDDKCEKAEAGGTEHCDLDLESLVNFNLLFFSVNLCYFIEG